ncbi:MAG: T9SS type A sorting domain-containing protein [Flavobacteriales bacterium]
MKPLRTSHFLLLSSIGFTVIGQSTFEKIYDANGVMSAIELPSQNLLVCMSGIWGTSILDPEGNILHTKDFGIDTIRAPRKVHQIGANDFYFITAYVKDTCGSGPQRKSYPLIGRMDSLGTVSNLHYYDLNSDCHNLAWDMEVTASRSVITWGGFFTLMVDSTGSPVWAKHFTGHGSVAFVRELPGGDLLMGMNMDTAGAVIARMDAVGNFIWCKSYIRPKGVVHDCLIESDSIFIVTGTTDSLLNSSLFDPLPPDYHPRLFMMQLNDTGSVQWCVGYSSDPNPWYAGQPSRIERTLDGKYLVLANLGSASTNQPYRPFLMKTDQNGDTLWTTSTGTTGYSYLTADLLAASDGGFLYSGVIYGNLPWNSLGDPFIFKTDSLGQLPCLNRSHQIDVSPIFPTDSSFAPISVNGVLEFPAYATDTVLDPITSYDGCSVLSGMSLMQVRKFRVRPNPNTGHFHVEFEDPLMAESYYSVFDAMGRLLYQRPLSAGATMEEVDLSRFGKGTYAIKLTDPEGVRYERVVLE